MTSGTRLDALHLLLRARPLLLQVLLLVLDVLLLNAQELELALQVLQVRVQVEREEETTWTGAREEGRVGGDRNRSSVGSSVMPSSAKAAAAIERKEGGEGRRDDVSNATAAEAAVGTQSTRRLQRVCNRQRMLAEQWRVKLQRTGLSDLLCFLSGQTECEQQL